MESWFAEFEFGGQEAPLRLCTEADEPRIAVSNAIDLATYSWQLAEQWSAAKRLSLAPEIILEFGRMAIQGIYECAGRWRDRFVDVDPYVPPNWQTVPTYIDEFCDYANSIEGNPIHAAAYVLWRIGWIHPFFDGNGRVARELSYLAFLVGHGVSEFAGNHAIPELIDEKYREKYFDGLREADKAWGAGILNVERLESLIAGLFIEQMASVDEPFE